MVLTTQNLAYTKISVILPIWNIFLCFSLKRLQFRRISTNKCSRSEINLMPAGWELSLYKVELLWQCWLLDVLARMENIDEHKWAHGGEDTSVQKSHIYYYRYEYHNIRLTNSQYFVQWSKLTDSCSLVELACTY